MAKLVSLGNDNSVPGRLSLLTRAFLAADMLQGAFISKAEATEYLNQSLSTVLYDRLIAAYGQSYYWNLVNFTTTQGVNDYVLPAIAPDFYKVVKLRVQFQPPNRMADVSRYDEEMESMLENTAFFLGFYGQGLVTSMGYRERGGNLHLIPIPTQGGLTMELQYAPTCPVMVNDSDTFDGINGWEEVAVLDTAIKMGLREDRDMSQLQARLARMCAELEAMAVTRDQNQPEVAHDFEASHRWVGGIGR